MNTLTNDSADLTGDEFEASEFVSPESKLQIPALYYLALILLVFGLATSLAARWIGARFDVHRTVT